MSGSYSDKPYFVNVPTWNPFGDHEVHFITGSISNTQQHENIDPDELWNRMYVNPKPVIVSCGFCKSHNAITNPICVQCGAPLGRSSERVYG
jgi:hypothetical protein